MLGRSQGIAKPPYDTEDLQEGLSDLANMTCVESSSRKKPYLRPHHKHGCLMYAKQQRLDMPEISILDTTAEVKQNSSAKITTGVF